MKTNAELATDLQELTEGYLETAVSLFQNLTEEQLLRPSASGGWSIAQCLEHLNTYADYYHPLLLSALGRGEVKGEMATRTGWLGRTFIRMMDPEKKGKYKAIKRHQPAGSENAYEVVSGFISRQEEFLNILDLARNRDLNKTRIPVSITSFFRLNIGETLQFLEMHTRRHMAQAKRNL